MNWKESVFCNEMDKDRICSFSPKIGQSGVKGSEKSLKYIKIKTLGVTRAETEAWMLERIEELKTWTASTVYKIGLDCVSGMAIAQRHTQSATSQIFMSRRQAHKAPSGCPYVVPK